MASPRKLRGLDVLVVNSSHLISDVGSKLARNCDFAMIWYYDHEDRINKVSLRSFHDHVDVSEIAKQFGGGGHKKAAGFTLPGDAQVDEIFDIEEEDFDEEEIEEISQSLDATESEESQSNNDEQSDKSPQFEPA